jgi:cytochrome o ubiquinol oxidase operon protein cyoD
MSADTHVIHADLAAGHGHSSLRSYLTGFGLSVVLTAIPFWLVMSGVLDSRQATALTIMVFAAAQIVVHMIFFLHMSASSENGWTMMALIFTLVIVVITLSGSLWVMYHLNVNMMPGHAMSQMP